MSGNGHRIGIVGTFDVANFGDLLFPLLADAALSERLGEIELRSYSYRRMKAPPWPYEVRSLNDLIDEISELDLLLVGGGHLLRTDPDVAPNYLPTATGLHHPTAYWFLPTILAASCGVPVVWNALGATIGLPVHARRLLALGAQAATYVSVRDQPSADELVAANSSLSPAIVPDTAFAIGELASSQHRTAANELLAGCGVTGRYGVIHSAREFHSHLPWVQGFAASLLDRQITPVEVTIGPVFGEKPDLLKSLPGIARVDAFPHPLVLAALLGGAEAVLAQSLHASIVALAHGAPVYRLAALGTEKHRLLESIPRVYYLDRPSADDVGQRRPDVQIEEARAQVGAHWDAIAALATRGRRPVDCNTISAVIGLRAESLLAGDESATNDHGAAGARRERELLLQSEALARLGRETTELRSRLRELSRMEGRWLEERAMFEAERAEHEQTRHERSDLQQRLIALAAERADVAAERDQAAAERDTLATARDDLETELRRLQESRSWRYTVGVRRFARWFRP